MPTTSVSTTTLPGGAAARLRIDPNGRFLYAPAANGLLYGFAIDGTSGALTAVPGGPFATGNGNMAVAVVEPKP